MRRFVGFRREKVCKAYALTETEEILKKSLDFLFNTNFGEWKFFSFQICSINWIV